MELAKKLFKIPYETCRLLIILGPFSQNGSQKYQKSIRFSTKSWWRFTTLQNTKKPLATQRFGACKKVVQNTLWNLSFIDTFGARFGKGPSKSSKSITFSLKVECIFRLCKTSKPISKTTFWSIPKSWWKYLIKPVEL